MLCSEWPSRQECTLCNRTDHCLACVFHHYCLEGRLLPYRNHMLTSDAKQASTGLDIQVILGVNKSDWATCLITSQVQQKFTLSTFLSSSRSLSSGKQRSQAMFFINTIVSGWTSSQSAPLDAEAIYRLKISEAPRDESLPSDKAESAEEHKDPTMEQAQGIRVLTVSFSTLKRCRREV